MRHKLLLADDIVTIQRVIELTFADEDIEVIAVSDGLQAIQRIARERPDIVLADIGMPERDGYEVAAFVKSDPSLAHIPVLLLAGAFEPIDEPRARAIGCDGVLVKPFEPQVIINRVRDLLAGRRPPELWSRPPAPQVAPEHPSVRSPDPLDEYFDHLDKAFGTRGTSVAPGPAVGPPSAGATDRLDESPVPPAPAIAGSGVSRTSAAPAGQRPPLAEAFAALLAAEQGDALRLQGSAPLSLPTVSWGPADFSTVVTPEFVDDVVRRVLERMADSVVRETVADIVSQVAERLVREEIERIKKMAS